MKGTMASPRQPPSKTVPDLRLFCPSEWDIPEETAGDAATSTTATATTTTAESSSEWEVASEANFRRISESSSEWLESTADLRCFHCHVGLDLDCWILSLTGSVGCMTFYFRASLGQHFALNFSHGDG